MLKQSSATEFEWRKLLRASVTKNVRENVRIELLRLGAK